MGLKSFLNETLSVNGSYDFVRVGVFAAMMVGLGLIIAQTAVGLRQSPPVLSFDLQAFGLGVGAILLAGGGAAWAKQSNNEG
jgi:hypothetical protein